MSEATTLTDFSSTDTEPQAETDDVNWPIHSNGHLIERFTPETHVRGSGDNDTAFRCIHCSEEVNIPEDRAVPDHEWAANRFSLQPCTTGSGGVV